MNQQASIVCELRGYDTSYGIRKEITLEQVAEDGFIVSPNKNVKGWVWGEVLNNIRNKRNTKNRVVATLDIDKATRDIFDELVDYFTKLNYKSLFHTSHSHDPDNDHFKYRGLIQLDKPIPSADYEGFYDYFINIHPKLKEWNDKGWLDIHGRTVSQFFHSPSCHPDRKSTARIKLIDGEPFSIDKYEDYVLNEEKPKPKKNGLNGHAKPKEQYNFDVVTISQKNPIADTPENRKFLDQILKAYPSTMEYTEWRNFNWSLKDFRWHDIKEIAYAWCKASNGYDEKADDLFEKIWDAEPTGKRITFQYIISKYKFDHPFAETPEDLVTELDGVLFFIQLNFALLVMKSIQLLKKSDLDKNELNKIIPIDPKNDQKTVIRKFVKSYRANNNLKAIPNDTLKNAIEEFYESPNTDTYTTFVCSPPKVKVPKDARNLWTPYPYTLKLANGKYAKVGDPNQNIVYLHRKELLANNDEQFMKYQMMLRAFKHKYPHLKSQVCPVILGEQGTGKGILTEFEKVIFGKDKVWVNYNLKDLTKFNSELFGKFHVHFNESVNKFTKEFQGQLKHWITDSTLVIEKKFVDKFEVESFIDYTIITNDQSAIVKEKTDRRYFHINISNAWRVDASDPQHIQNANQNKWDLCREEIEKGSNSLLIYEDLKMCYDELDRYKADYGKDFRPYPPPRTAEDLKQKLDQLDKFDNYIREILNKREFPYYEFNDPSPKEYKHNCFISCTWLLDSFRVEGRISMNERPEVALNSHTIKHRMERIFPQANVSKGKKRKCYVTGKETQCFLMPDLPIGRDDFRRYLKEPKFKYDDE